MPLTRVRPLCPPSECPSLPGSASLAQCCNRSPQWLQSTRTWARITLRGLLVNEANTRHCKLAAHPLQRAMHSELRLCLSAIESVVGTVVSFTMQHYRP